jgi:hypothetical protein
MPIPIATTATAAPALWIAEPSLLTAVAQCQDGAATPSLYALDPALPVLLRPDGAVQFGGVRAAPC